MRARIRRHSARIELDVREISELLPVPSASVASLRWNPGLGEPQRRDQRRGSLWPQPNCDFFAQGPTAERNATVGFSEAWGGQKDEPQKMAAQRRWLRCWPTLLASPASVVSRQLATRALLASLTSLNRLRFSITSFRNHYVAPVDRPIYRPI